MYTKEIERKWAELNLEPIYYKMYIDIFSVFFFLFLGLYTLFLVHNIQSAYLNIIFIPFMTIYFGFFIHSLSLFFHEAAHYNLHKNKKWNDIIATILLMPFVGLPIKEYRTTHWQHHAFLGESKDTEISYRDNLSYMKITYIFLGIYTLQIIYRYIHNFSNISNKQNKTKLNDGVKKLIGSMLICTILQIAISMIIYKYTNLFYAFAWLFSFGIIYPGFEKIRQTLEHKSTGIEHVTNRNFGESFFACYFGAAGFNKHILHHWSPQTHYTLFAEFEKFIMNTELKNIYISANSTYHGTFKILLKDEK